MARAGTRRRARTLQKLSILREVDSVGRQVTGVLDITAETAPQTTLQAELSALLTGGMRDNALQIYEIAAEDSHQLYIQPFDGMDPVPGEHHVVVPRDLGSATMLTDAIGGRRWYASGAAQLEARLNADPSLKAAVSSVHWAWKLGIDSFKYTWLMQSRPMAEGKTHVVMQATGRTRAMAHDVGFDALARILDQLERFTSQSSEGRDRRFLERPAFAQILDSVRRGEPVRAYPAPSTRAVDCGHAILEALEPHAGRKLFVRPFSRHKEQNVRASVLPRDARDVPILALVDLTFMGSAKDAVAFTPTHCYLRDGDERLSFEWPDVRAVRKPDKADALEILVHLSTVGEIALPAGHRAGAMYPLMSLFASMP